MERTGETAAMSAMSLVDAADEAARAGRSFGIAAIESFAGHRSGRPGHGGGLIEDLTGAFGDIDMGFAMPLEETSRATADLFDRMQTGMAMSDDASEEQPDALIEIVASPGSQLRGSLMPGDIIVQRALGEGQLASLSVVVDGRLHRRSALASAGLTPLGAGDGLYVHIIEGGPVAKPQDARRARCIADGHGRLRRDVVVLRVQGSPVASATDETWPLRAPVQRAPFRVRLEDGPSIEAQARESIYGWAGDRVEVKLGDLSVQVQQVGPGGVFEIPSGSAELAVVTNVTRAGTSRSSAIWRLVGNGPTVLVPGEPQSVQISTRLRMSLWAFTPPLAKNIKGKDVLLDEELLALLKQANIDDLSLVWTITWDQRDKNTDRAKKPRWHAGFIPLHSEQRRTSPGLLEEHRTSYLRHLIDALHAIGVQVVPGFELVRATKKPEDIAKMNEKERAAHATITARAQDFADWLLKATTSDIEEYASSINAFFEDRGLDVDGIGFDFEFDQLTERHRPNLELLYRKTSDAIAHHNGMVSYANAPFQEDGVNKHGFMRAQPFALAKTGLNLLARPMCFNGTDSTSLAEIKASIACALRRPRNPSDPNAKTPPGGAGLHPSQVQFGIWADKVEGGVEALCRDVLRPNRVGLMLYNLPSDSKKAKKFLIDSAKWNVALNPCEGSPGQGGKPLQVPRGFGGWPPPFKVPSASRTSGEQSVVPRVPSRVSDLKTAPFPGRYANPLTPNQKLQTALDRAIAAGPGTGWRTPVVVVALGSQAPHAMAHFKGNEVHYSASLLKVAAMYTAFELRNTLRDIAAELGGKASKSDLLKDAAMYLNPRILAQAATIPALKGVAKHHALPQYASMFQVIPLAQFPQLVAMGLGSGFAVDFSTTFASHLEKMIVESVNYSAAQCVHGSGYGYLNGVLAAAGFFDPSTSTGVWLAGDYIGNYPAFRINSVNDGPAAQATTALDLARMYTLLHDGTLVGGISSAEMLELLAKAVAKKEVFIDRASGALDFQVTHAKVGLGPLKAKHGGFDVYSEGSILEHTSGRKFVAVWQNFAWGSNGFDPIGHVIRDTIREFLRP